MSYSSFSKEESLLIFGSVNNMNKTVITGTSISGTSPKSASETARTSTTITIKMTNGFHKSLRITLAGGFLNLIFFWQDGHCLTAPRPLTSPP